MVPNVQGFLYPSVNEEVCNSCGKCLKVCAYIDSKGIGAELFPNTQVFAVKHIDDKVRIQSSSGGAFTAISDYVLKNNGVVYGASYDEQMVVRHVKVDSFEGRDSMRGSKYVQSNLGKVFKDIQSDLHMDLWVLFSGTPCQVAGLRKYLGKPYDNLITVDLVCHGVPSPKIFGDYIQSIEKRYKDKVLDCRFRDKREGWKNLTLKICFGNIIKYIQSNSSTYYSLFLSNTNLRPCCYECKFANFNRTGDITIGDYWGIGKSHPEFEDKKGVSLILVNSRKGQSMFKTISSSLNILPSDHQKCLQKNLVGPTTPNSRKDEFWTAYNEFGYSYVAKRYGGGSVYSKSRRLVKRIVIHTPLMNIYRTLRKA
jgi:coenzyme F420-reducing hydrogenase beta subunit